MEVFIGFTKDDDFTLLQATLERWDACANVQLAAIQCDPKKFEIARRVAADKMAKCNFYILADLGCVLVKHDALEGIEEKLSDKEETLIGLLPDDGFSRGCSIIGGIGWACPEGRCTYCDWVRETAKLPAGVRICRKGAVEKWLPKSTDTYDQEHAESVKLAGGLVGLCPDIFYKRLQGPKPVIH